MNMRVEDEALNSYESGASWEEQASKETARFEDNFQTLNRLTRPSSPLHPHQDALLSQARGGTNRAPCNLATDMPIKLQKDATQ